jgi:hypothetical protein
LSSGTSNLSLLKLSNSTVNRYSPPSIRRLHSTLEFVLYAVEVCRHIWVQRCRALTIAHDSLTKSPLFKFVSRLKFFKNTAFLSTAGFRNFFFIIYLFILFRPCTKSIKGECGSELYLGA